MDTNTLEILNLIASFLTPIALLVFGILFNRTLELSKSVIAKEKGWQELWAAQFVEVAKDYNNSVTDYVIGMRRVVQTINEKLSGWEDDRDQQQQNIKKYTWELKYLEWQIQNFTQFVKEKNDVNKKREHLFDLLAGMLPDINSSKGITSSKLKDIQLAQFEFNKAVRVAHADMLKISPD